MISKRIDKLYVEISETRAELGVKAAKKAQEVIKAAIGKKGYARVVFASAPSQNEFLENLVNSDIDWSKVIAFQQDEYVNAALEDSYSFGKFLKDRLFDIVKPGAVHYMNGQAIDAQEECQRYARLLMEDTLDLFCLGIGENGHIAFNEPHEADFKDSKIMKIITLDEKCRQQQYHDNTFKSLDDVPRYGITVTIPAILKAKVLIAMVPGERKAEAVAKTLDGAIEEKCPASILRTHNDATLFVDIKSAANAVALRQK